MRRITGAVIKMFVSVWEVLKSPARTYMFLGSRGFSVFSIVLLLLMFAVWLLPFQVYGIPAPVVRNIANREWLFRVP
ncbi:MAG: hypothetical protein ACYC21_11140, partial [Eubacteriales bacterium]